MTDAALLLQQPDGMARELALIDERTVLGRDPECEIVIAGRLISRQHACITRVGRLYILEDLGSRNGTTVNGQLLTAPWTLHDGDCIELGGIGKLIFIDGDATSTRPTPPAVGVWLDSAAQDAWVDGQRLMPQLSPAQFGLLKLLVEHVDQVCSRDQIVAAIWPDVADGVSDEAIDALVKRVRARLGEVPTGQRYLATLRGRGLILRSSAALQRP